MVIPRNAVDVDGDGNITIDEFVEKGLQSKFINDLLLTTKVDKEQCCVWLLMLFNRLGLQGPFYKQRC